MKSKTGTNLYRPRVKKDVEGCPVYVTSQVLGKAWTILILQTLMAPHSKNGLRFNQIQKDLSWVSPKILSQRLKDLTSDGILSREVKAERIPPHVTYRLTKKGADLRGVLAMMQKWGMKHGGDISEKCLGKGFSHCDGCREGA
ncbi:MAG: helix-turn-helix transcriptional regulator [Candidatus Thorarchaeota archaeon]|nr:helix-turn-helix transcriptional regulator [Candidatus Thorarchaeota archaeon]